MSKIFDKEVAECVGLWLAEGDNKTLYEVTFTNNSLKLVEFFCSTIQQIYKGKNQPRLYTYGLNKPLKSHVLSRLKRNNYTDIRATKPYYIFRIADRKFVKHWHKLVANYSNKLQFTDAITRGIFAGEGNIKTGSHSRRTLRISQKTRKDLF